MKHPDPGRRGKIISQTKVHVIILLFEQVQEVRGLDSLTSGVLLAWLAETSMREGEGRAAPISDPFEPGIDFGQNGFPIRRAIAPQFGVPGIGISKRSGMRRVRSSARTFDQPHGRQRRACLKTAAAIGRPGVATGASSAESSIRRLSGRKRSVRMTSCFRKILFRMAL
jgi:hypothetical protein